MKGLFRRLRDIGLDIDARVPETRIPKVVKVALTAATTFTGGDVLGWANPEKRKIIITGLFLDVTTQATGTPTVDAGVAADATTSSDDLIDGCAIGAATGVFNSIADAGTNGEGAVVMSSSQYLTITPSASAAGLVGNAYIQYVIA